MTRTEEFKNALNAYKNIDVHINLVLRLIGISAIEKQIPKKILYRKQNYGTPWLCCECEADQTPTEFFSTDGSEPKEKHTFCWKCGQRLDWGDYK
jgi:hypothetical protein